MPRGRQIIPEQQSASCWQVVPSSLRPPEGPGVQPAAGRGIGAAPRVSGRAWLEVVVPARIHAQRTARALPHRAPAFRSRPGTRPGRAKSFGLCWNRARPTWWTAGPAHSAPCRSPTVSIICLLRPGQAREGWEMHAASAACSPARWQAAAGKRQRAPWQRGRRTHLVANRHLGAADGAGIQRHQLRHVCTGRRGAFKALITSVQAAAVLTHAAACQQPGAAGCRAGHTCKLPPVTFRQKNTSNVDFRNSRLSASRGRRACGIPCACRLAWRGSLAARAAAPAAAGRLPPACQATHL